MLEAPVHCIDFEGTAISGVLEYGVATLQGGEIVSLDTRLCAPRGPIHPLDTEVHGLHAQLLRGCATFEADKERFFAYRRSGPLCAHHAAFEQRLLKSHWACPPRVPSFLQAGEQVNTWGPWLDTLLLYQVAYPGRDSYKLRHLIEALSLQAELEHLARRHCPPLRSNYHTASYDALACALLLKHLLSHKGWCNLTIGGLLKTARNTPQAAQEELF